MELIENNLENGLRIAGAIQYIKGLSENHRKKILKSVTDRTKGRPFEITAVSILRSTLGHQIQFEVHYKEDQARQGWTISLGNFQ